MPRTVVNTYHCMHYKVRCIGIIISDFYTELYIYHVFRRFRRSGQKRVNSTPCTEEQEGRNHRNIESPYEVVAINTLQTSKTVRQTNGNPCMVQCDEGQYEIPLNVTLMPTTVDNATDRTIQNPKLIMQQETSAAHVYESITQCSRNTEHDCASKTSRYVTMGMSQPESLYATATGVQDEYSRNFQDDYELMTPSPPVSSHNQNESRDPSSPCCSSASFRFDVSLPTCNNANTLTNGNHSIKTENAKESLTTNLHYVNLGNGSKRFSKEGHVGHYDSNMPRNHDEPGYVNMTSGVTWHSGNKY